MSDVIYIIIPKVTDNANELALWELEQPKVAHILAPASSPGHLTSSKLSRNALVDVTAIAFHESGSDDEPQCLEALLSAIEGRDARFFIHFGDQDMPKYLAQGAIEAAFVKRFPGCDPRKYKCFPFTGSDKEQFHWNVGIWAVRRALFGEKPDASIDILRELDAAWKLADLYFNYSLIRFEMLVAFFQLYVTLADADAAGVLLSQADKDAAVQAACVKVGKSFANWEPVIRAEMMDSSDVKTRFPFEYSGKGPATLPNPSRFVTWYEMLSASYTEMMGMESGITPVKKS